MNILTVVKPNEYRSFNRNNKKQKMITYCKRYNCHYFYFTFGACLLVA